jgi:alkyldihydroxyacetonephosphate synthase
MVASFADGVDAVRELMRDGTVPDLVRLSDDVETRMLARADGALLLCAAIGSADHVDASLARIGKSLGRRARPLGPSPYARWYETRYDAPYLRDALIERGYLADSLETSTLWSNVTTAYRAVRDALVRALDPHGRALVLCHLSHAHAEGASLYFTFVAPGGDDAIERWWAAKRAALDAMVNNGATVSHHHGIGRDHRDWQARRLGETGMRAIDAIAQALDPDRVLAANR